ncbi:hypothetical protein HO133_000074 [Letharia lupina]|uniref:Uncharacterized protein n=1 Tax=Letharia lupina TaxID=560253 RepID=A0A8H6CGR6_9LECA|nr:uncharacterized protein HO133_000074 [Letharia lupina]KAF6223232.1 hypothetical protein HO133_000074 [Letharia lupina]
MLWYICLEEVILNEISSVNKKGPVRTSSLSLPQSSAAILNPRFGRIILVSPTSTMATSLENFDVCVPNDKASLYKFSREVRDEVYRYLVKGTYIIAVPPSLTSAARFTATGGVGYDPDGADFSILRVSKTLGQEAIGVLYAESIFEFYLNFSEDGPCTQYAIKVTGRMMRFKYQMFGLGAPFQSLFDLSRLSRPYLENMKDICDSTIDHFTSTDITRHSMQIILRVTRELDDTLSSPLFLAMKRLEGFRTLRVELRSSLPIFEKGPPARKRPLERGITVGRGTS